MLGTAQLKTLLINELPRMRRFAYSLTGNKSDADDLVQSLVEKLLRKGIKKDIPEIPWFLKVCKNLWIDETRANQSRRKLAESTAQEPITVNEAGPENDQMAQILKAMEQLNDEQRQLVGLVIVEGFSYAEAARTLDIPVGTVMSRVARARAKLAQLLTAP